MLVRAQAIEKNEGERHADRLDAQLTENASHPAPQNARPRLDLGSEDGPACQRIVEVGGELKPTRMEYAHNGRGGGSYYSVDGYELRGGLRAAIGADDE